jgi:hypothetical protein
VTAIDVWPDKAQEARSLGAGAFMTFNQATAAAEAGGSFDLLLNCASAKLSTPALLGLLRTSGTLVQLGIPGMVGGAGWGGCCCWMEGSTSRHPVRCSRPARLPSIPLALIDSLLLPQAATRACRCRSRTWCLARSG